MTKFPGKIGRTVEDSTPWWPDMPNRNEVAPNIVTILFDDTGWADFGCFGSEVRTPHIDALANAGLRYTNFHVTPLCSPTRASFLTGRNHHSVGMRCLADTDTGFPNSRGAINEDVPLMPQMLRDGGYGTYMVGKWHLTPAAEVTPAGPFKNWPANRGFDRYYGFLGGCTDHYAPELIQDNHGYEPTLNDDYHLSEDLADRAITYMRDHVAFRGREPLFLNFCFGATHAPIQVAKDYIDPYVPVFEKGWDKTRADRLQRQKEMGLLPDNTDLVPRNPEVPAWDSLDPDQKRLYTRLQAAYAGFLEHADAQIGRVVTELKRLDLFDNTIVMIFSDNGASREGGNHGAIDVNAPYSGTPETVAEMIDRIDDIGGPRGPAHYPQGWAMAGNTPFRRYKQFVELGGVRSPLVVSWPLGIQDGGGVRDQFLHVIDLAPTIMDLAGNRRAGLFDGASFRLTLNNRNAPAPRSSQHWEMFGRRAVYCDGWKAITEHEKGDNYGDDVWRLYDTHADASECHDIAAQHPDKLKELQDIWWQEAETNDVFPLDDRSLVEIILFRQPGGLMTRRELTFHPGQGHIPELSMIASSDRSMTVTAHFGAGWTGEEGVLLSSGDELGGYTFYIKAGQLCFEHVWKGVRTTHAGPMSQGATTAALTMHVIGDSSATCRLFADGSEIAAGPVPCVSGHLSLWGLDIGRDAARPVSAAYDAPFSYPGAHLDRVVLRFFDDIEASDLAATMEAAE